MRKNIFIIIAPVIIVALLSGCVENTIPPSWPPPANPVASPVITSISPADSAIGGVLDITFNGSNFGTTVNQCSVYFGTEPGIITSFSSNQIVVLRPIVYGEAISTRIVVQLADDIAKRNYKIKRVVTPLGAFPGATLSNTITSDTSGNVYVAFNSAHDTSGNKIIRKISANGIMSDYALYLASLTIACIRVAPNGTLYALMTGSNGEFHSVAPGGGTLTKLFGFAENMTCFDFDQNGVIYAGGTKGTNKTIDIVQATTVAKGPLYDKYNIVAVRVFQNYVYVLAVGDTTTTGVYRHQISGGTLGTQEQVFLWSATGDYAASKPKDLTFSATGDIYIATDRSVDPILLVYYSTGTVTRMRPLYKNIITTAVGGLTWTHNILYERVAPPLTSSDPPSIVAIDMGNSGAPYYGR